MANYQPALESRGIPFRIKNNENPSLCSNQAARSSCAANAAAHGRQPFSQRQSVAASHFVREPAAIPFCHLWCTPAVFVRPYVLCGSSLLGA